MQIQEQIDQDTLNEIRSLEQERTDPFIYPCILGKRCVFMRDNGVSKTCGYGLGCIEEREHGIF